MKKTFTALFLLIVAIILLALVFDWGRGSVVAPTIPATAADATDTPIIVSYPLDNQTVTSPIHISGVVHGSWFFEGSFPVELVNSNGEVIGTTTASTDGDWATTTDVNFTATVSYPKATTTDRGFLVLKNDNPSGDQAHDEEKFIQLILK